MELGFYDYFVIAAYLLMTIGIGLWFRSRASKNVEEYFVSGRSLPWWIAGTSMVATTFAADTPLAVTGLTIQYGLAGNWLWWAFAFGGMVTVFVYSKLWRRAGVLTDVELVELRYSGKPAEILRGTRAVYIALLVNPIIIGWVTGAMITVLDQTIFFDPAADSQSSGSLATWVTILVTLALIGVYGLISGMWGVAIADAVQFYLAITGCIGLAYYALADVGGAVALEASVINSFGQGGAEAFRLIPDFSQADAWITMDVFLIMLLVQWWATWYPGAEPGGGGYVVQRMAACKDERHSMLATLWYQLAHYCIRPWPWIIVGFAALVMFPELRAGEIADGGFDSGVGFPMVMRKLGPQLPSGLQGLLLVTFFAAFMSTISTQMNWGASYLVRDVYQRFLNPDASDQELAKASKLLSLVVLIAGALASFVMINVSVDEAWKILLALGAGTGAVFMLRWFWWRINAWSEISAMLFSFFAFLTIDGIAQEFGWGPIRKELKIFLIAVGTIFVWVLVTYLTPPESDETLDNFYRKIRPAGNGWGPVARRNPDVKVTDNLLLGILGAISGSGLVYCFIPLIGNLIFQRYQNAIYCGAGVFVFGILVALIVRRLTTPVAAPEIKNDLG